MSTHSALHPQRRTAPHARRPPAARPRKSSDAVSVSSAADGHPPKPHSQEQTVSGGGGERTVKKLRLSKALTIPEGTTVSDACRRMAHRRVDSALLTDGNGLLSGIVTDKDIAARVVAEGLRPEQTAVSKIMTRNPVFVASDTLAIEALHKMVHGKFRHLPIVENGEVVAMLDITKCLYDAILRMEKAAEQGSAIAAAVEGVERHRGSKLSAQHAFIETLRDRMFKPSLSTIITENTKVAVVSPSDPVYLATKKMREYRVNSVVIAVGGKPQGILTSKDVLMRIVAQNLCPELTLVEKVMTEDIECATMETTILDALHSMHDGKFLHLPVLDHDGCIVACLDVLQITHAAISMFDGGPEGLNDMSNMMMQKFWDSTLPLEPTDEEYDNHSEVSALLTSEAPEAGRIMYPSTIHVKSFPFKFVDQKGRVHRFNCGTESLIELLTAIGERAGAEYNRENTQLLYEDDEGDKVLLITDSDLVGAVNHARAAGWKVLRLHLDNSNTMQMHRSVTDLATTQTSGWTSVQAGVFAGALFLTGVGITACMKRYH